MKLNRFLTTVLLFLVGVQGVAFGAAKSLAVLSASPKGAQHQIGRKAVSVHFNQAVAPISENTAFSTKDCPLQITPVVEGTCRYSGTQTLLFEPAENWPLATRFTVTVPAGFTSKVSRQKLAKKYAFSFSTDTPIVTRVLPYDNEHWLTLTPTLFVQFSQPVDVENMDKFVTLSVGNTTVKTAVRPAEEIEIEKNFPYTENKNIVAISPLEKLHKGQKYTLTLRAGLPAQSGNLGLAKEYKTSFYTYPDLEIQNTQNRGCLPFTPTVDFSTPVRLGALYQSAEVTPKSAKKPLAKQEENQLGTEHVDNKQGTAFFRTGLSFIDVQPDQPVQVTIKKGLQDIYGNRLNEEVTLYITPEGYCPSVDFSGGRGVLESYLKPYLPIDLMNISSLPVRGARFNKNNFIPFDQTEISYCKEAPLAHEELVGDYSFPNVKNKTIHTFLDLKKFNFTPQDSIVFSQIQVKRGADEKPCWVSSTDNLTDVGVTFKTSPENILLWATSLKEGTPLAGYAVELRDTKNRVLWTGQTDVDGLARADGWNKLGVELPRWGMPEIYAFVTSPNGDSVVSNLWNDGMELWRFNVEASYNPQENVARAHLFTERGIYRPSETVYIKGILRMAQNGEWQIPAQDMRGRVTITNARGEEFFKQDVSLSADYGSFDLKITLPKTAPTGYWNVSFVPLSKAIAQEQAEAYTSFQVEDVEPAAFQVNLRPAQRNYIGGEEAKFYLSAAYQFGAPLGKAPVKWTLRESWAEIEMEGYKDYIFTPYFLEEDYFSTPEKLLVSTSGELDTKGDYAFTAKLPQEKFAKTVYAQASVTSPSKQELFARTSITLHPADFYIGTKVKTEDVQVNKPVSIHIIARTPEGKPVQTTATARIFHEQWFSVRKSGLAGRLEWVNDKKVTPVETQTIEIGKKGTTLAFTPKTGGRYVVELTAKDLFGRTVTGGAATFALEEGNPYVEKSNDDLIKLTANKNEYKVGQTARIQVASPYANARALVTVEREGILDAWITELKGTSESISVKIKENYLPNVYVGVVVIQGRTDKPITEKLDLGKPQSKAGYVLLNVRPSGKKLQTVLKTDRTNYHPRETVSVDIRTQANSKGVPTEVTLFAVDEGILALTHYKTPDWFEHFYSARPLSVFTMDNRAFLIGQRSFGEKGENRGGGGSALSALGGTDLRSNFQFTPFFKANVHTNEKGRAHVEFTLPDNLTAFRIMAVASGRDTFGSAEKSIRVSKPLMIQANLPRFVRQGDIFKCSAIIHNYEDKKGMMTLQAAAQGLTLQNSAAQTVQVPLGQTREVTWPCQANGLGKADVSFTVRGEKEQDGVRQTVEVVTIEKFQTLSAYGATSNTQIELLDKPANLRKEAQNQVKVTLSSTALVQLKGALSYLLTYPYDCLEQQFSKILPLITSQKMAADFGLITPQQTQEIVQNVLGNIGAYQDPSGGFSYWKNDTPDAFLTAYVLEISQLAKQAGYQVDQLPLQKAVHWLAQAFFNGKAVQTFDYTARETQTAQAYAIYVLSQYGQNMQGNFHTLYEKRNTLSPQGVAYLLMAAQQLNEPASVKEKLAQQLLNHVVYNPSSAYVDGGKEMPFLHADNVTATALFLTAFLQTNTPLDNAYQFVSWLTGELNAQGAWKNTFANAQAARALAVYYEKEEKQSPHFTAQVSQNSQTLVTHAFEGRSLVPVEQVWNFADIYGLSQEARLEFKKQGTGTLYYTVGQSYEPRAFATPLQAGFSVSRAITTTTGEAVSQITAGERYTVTLTVVSNASRSFVVLEDFIPAGFEIINKTLATSDAFEKPENEAFTRSEIYKDRIAAFASFLPAGEHTYSYEVMATVRGTFAYPAAWVNQMYEPDVFGRNATTTLVIE